MLIFKPLTAAVLGVLVGLGSSSVALAKGHDQGVADGSRPIIKPGDWRGGFVAGRDRKGVGFDRELGFLGVAADLDADMIYGRDVVSVQRIVKPRR